MLIGNDVNGVIPSLPFTKDIYGIEFSDFTDYRTGNRSSELPMPTTAYWKSLDDVLTAYIRHNDNKFDYIGHVAHRKHIIADRIRFIGKESNNLEENLYGIEEPEYLEYKNNKEFFDWILTLKPKDVKDKGISKRTLNKIKHKIKRGKILNPKTKIVKILILLYKETKLNDKDYYS
jgi:hypothetical protein